MLSLSTPNGRAQIAQSALNVLPFSHKISTPLSFGSTVVGTFNVFEVPALGFDSEILTTVLPESSDSLPDSLILVLSDLSK